MQDRTAHRSPQAHERVRVLWAIKGLGPGGAERLLLHHATAANPQQFDLRCVYLVPEKSHLVAPLEAAGVDVALLATRHQGDLRWLLRLRQMLLAHPVDVVHAHAPLVAAGARVVARSLPRRARPAVMSTEHNRWPRHRMLTRLVNRLTLGLDDATIAVSEDVRSTMSTRHQYRVRVIQHGIPLNDVRSAGARHEVRRELALADDDVVLVCLANLRREKGHADLLRAVALAKDDAPALRVLLVGQGPLTDEITGLTHSLGVGDRVALLGYREDAIRVLSAADGLVLASHHEGLPVALMEARALGLPVVATSVGGIPEAVTHDKDGLLVPPADPAALAASLVRFTRDADLRRRLAANAALQGERFDVRAAVSRLELLYQELRESNRSRNRVS